MDNNLNHLKLRGFLHTRALPSRSAGRVAKTLAWLIVAVAMFTSAALLLQISWSQALGLGTGIVLTLGLGMALVPQDARRQLRAGTRTIDGVPLLQLLNGGAASRNTAGGLPPSRQPWRANSNVRK